MLNADGRLALAPPPPAEPLGEWPPEGAEPLDPELLYDRLADAGLDLGPAFQAVTRAWRRGEEVFAELSLADEHAPGAERFALHPALLAVAAQLGTLDAAAEGSGPALPAEWRRVGIEAVGARGLRVRATPGEEGVSLTLAGLEGEPLARVGAVIARSLPADLARAASARRRGLIGLAWRERALAAAPQGAEAADGQRLWRLGPASTEAAPPDAARDACARALAEIQAWLSREQPAPGERLALLTEGALVVAEGEDPDPAAAAVWGLIRSAQAEHPGSFLLIDTDGSAASEEALAAALAQADEPQLALREGVALVPRATRLAASEEGGRDASLDPERTVLLTGGSGALAALAARHLVAERGARRLLLASRRGERAEGAAELRADLEELGAEVTIAACDVSDRAALEELLAAIPAEHPLGAVIHTAGVVEDATVESLDAEAFDPVFAPKVDAAWALHELTADAGLSHFVLYSAAAGAIGAAGQGNYAAANAFLDGLAAMRAAAGLPATSIAWGLWGGDGMGAELREADLARLRQGGLAALSAEQGLALLDAALTSDRAEVLGLGIDPAGLRGLASLGALPPVLAELTRLPRRRAAGAGGELARQLAELPEAEREGAVLGLVRSQVAAVLGHSSAEEIEPDRAFQELGFDSLAALELRNRLGLVTGVPLAATVVFDHPSATALAEHLLAGIGASEPAARVAVRAQASDEPIAIVGMACRFPGGVASPEDLWRLLEQGGDAVGEFPVDRGWDVERLYNPDPESFGTSYSKHGGFLYDAAEFDPEFFNISPREAIVLDPQQRLLLEGAWEALEAAGIDPATLRGEPAGVFAGVSMQDYGVSEIGISPGSTASVVSGRVSYTLGLEGPTMTIDTACSSSLVAIHLASQALRGGECGLALAGGVTVLSTPALFKLFSAQRGLAPDGRCKSFAEAADGTGWAEGLGVLVLERLSDAEANGHEVLATIRGSAINQDGASNGLTAPNGPSQERVIRQALANARLAPADVDMVEAHGTGTTLGDPIEAGALLATYGQEREAPLRLGSLKSNIGHAQAAAGVGGVIKSVMAMRAGLMPRTLHVDAPSTKVDWEAGAIELLTEPREWPNSRPRRAGVSSFGASGTNAHLILEQGPEPAPAAEGEGGAESLSGPVPLALSARSEEALRGAAERLRSHLQANPEQSAVDTAYSLVMTRSAFEQRAVAVGAERDELLEALAAIARGEPSPATARATARPGRSAFLLTGQGSQRAGMGRELYGAYPAYAEALNEALVEIDPHLDRPLRELLFAEPGSERAALLDDTTYAQPALFATHVALHRLLETWGLAPDLLVGHSVGEISAAQIAGVLSLADAAKLICARATLMGALPAGGAMLAIGAGEAAVAKAIEGREAELSIAGVNSPTSTVISGAEAAIDAQEALWSEKGAKTKRLAVSHAFHSPLIEPMMDEFAEVARELTYSEPRIPIVSNVSGEVLAAERATDPAYWVSHLRAPVRFAESVATLQAQGATTLLELGPDPVLTAMAAECLVDEERAPALIPTLRAGRAEPEVAMLALGAAHAAGAKVDWAALFAASGARKAPLPTYPFQRQPYWLVATEGGGDPTSVGLAPADHPLLGAILPDPTGEGLTLTGRISLASHPWLADHAVAGTVLIPGTVFLELALHAAERLGAEQVAELRLEAPLVLPEAGSVRIQVAVGAPGEDGRREIGVFSRPAALEAEEDESLPWALNAEGLLADEAPAAPEPLGAWPPEGAEPLEAELLYDRLADAGLDYGPAFQGLDRAWKRGEAVFAEVSLGEGQEADASSYSFHPALLDSACQAISLAELEAGSQAPALPSAWRGVSAQMTGPGAARVSIELGEGESAIALHDANGEPLARIGALERRPVSAEQLRVAARRRQGLIGIEWRQRELPAAGEDPGAAVELWRWTGEQDEDLARAARNAAAAALAAIQAWLSREEASVEDRFAILTEGAVAADREEAPDPVGAAIWGLARAAQAEHPGRFVLIDSDGSEASEEALAAALAQEDESQVALRGGAALVPRATRLDPETPGEDTPALEPGSTVLITGATGALGALTARRLVEAHGARRLLLVSRAGEEAPGAQGLKRELEELGAEVAIAACDASDRAALEDWSPRSPPTDRWARSSISPA